MPATAKLNIFQRTLNRVGRPLGILPYPIGWERGPDDPGERQSVFENIHDENWWDSGESVSGPGSERARTAKYRKALIGFLQRHRLKSLFDAPCGDLNWMADVFSEVHLHYIGGDISEAVLAIARSRCPELDLRHFDICVDRFPDVDVWHCRDTLLHLSFADIWTTLANAARSNIKYALITTHRGRVLRNLDVRTGGARPLDLQRSPFNFPRPLEYLGDSSGWGFPRAVGVWPMDVIRERVGGHGGTNHLSSSND